MVRREGFVRMWRGAPAVVVACIPGHAAYFSVYEAGKRATGVDAPGHHPVAAAAVGGVSTMLHDAIITPMDLVKQRLQVPAARGRRPDLIALRFIFHALCAV